MRTKIVTLKSGDRITLYLNEDTNEWTRFKEEAQDVFHKQILEGIDNKARVIRKYYASSKSLLARKKIRDMVNESPEKMDLLYETIITLRR
jgi:hypothetical protein